MAKLDVPVIAVITGEGCSGGALGLAVANKVLVLEHAYYTVISPEGCASILWRDAAKASDAADALKITGPDLLKFNIIDGVVKEPLGGAHYDYEAMGEELKKEILKALDEYKNMSAQQLKTTATTNSEEWAYLELHNERLLRNFSKNQPCCH